MTTHHIRLEVKPIPRRFARVYEDRGLPIPMGSSGHAWAALVPYGFRAFHRAYAKSLGYFWLHCLWCEQPYGGHEITGAVKDPTRPGRGITICPQCTRSRGQREAQR